MSSEPSSVQKLFLKLCFMFKQINLDVFLSPTSSETVQLRVPRDLSEDHKQIGSIQYGGVKYPITHGSHLNLKYVELRLESGFLKEIKVFKMLHELLGERDANGCLKYKFTYADDEIKLAKSLKVWRESLESVISLVVWMRISLHCLDLNLQLLNNTTKLKRSG